MQAPPSGSFVVPAFETVDLQMLQGTRAVSPRCDFSRADLPSSSLNISVPISDPRAADLVMPKVTSQRTFAACWTCRRRGIRCDNAAPYCGQCARSHLPCAGYDVRLVWVDSETGTYEPEQRRAYPCQLTWKGYRIWSLKEVGHLISYAEKKRCRCCLHSYHNPFMAFCASEKVHSPEQYEEPQGSTHQEGPQTELCDYTPPFVTTPAPSDGADSIEYLNLGLWESSLPQTLSLSLIPDGSHQDNELLHHYISYVSRMMTPIDDSCNPWKSTYPCLAVSEVTSTSGRSLLHGILAQSAFHLANLKQAASAIFTRVAARHFGLALRHLRSSLARPLENFSTTLAAMLTITLAGHVFCEQSVGLTYHLHGAVRYVAQHVAQKPWKDSHEAWIITQSFALHTLMSQITSGPSVDTRGTITTLDGVLQDVMSNPSFAYTLGSTPRLIKGLYEARLLEAKWATGSTHQKSRPHLSVDQLIQISKILAEIDSPLDAEVELYVSRQWSTVSLEDQRRLIVSNLGLFKSAVTIYILRMVLGYPPSAVAQQVHETLSSATALLKNEKVAVSIWPIFMASVEAYTSEAQSLADNVWRLCTGFGVSNRAMIHRLVKCVWTQREETAAQQQCDVGDVLVDWRQVLKDLDVEILLL